MAKRKKYPKLPNGYGSIKYLGKGRRNPYGVYPPTTEFTLEGIPVTQPALCYVDSWLKGFSVLMSFKAGTYTPGMEKGLKIDDSDVKGLSELAQKILADYNRVKGIKQQEEKGKTFEEVYNDFFKYKYESPDSKTYSQASVYSTRAAFKNCAALHDREFCSLRHDDLQGVLNACSLKHSSQELILSLYHQLYAYADIYELCEKDYSAHVKIPKEDDDEHGVAFTEAELKILWANKSDPIVELILIMCYSGYRISAYKTMEVNLEDKFFRGGVKTKAGKNRIVPIHSGIYDFVWHRMEVYGKLLPMTANSFRPEMYATLNRLNLASHTPHDCRHTFSYLCEKYGINENDRKRMLGHSFGGDITNGIYGHREIEDLRKQIEKIKICC